MVLPKDLLSDTYRKPNVFLCETDKQKICKLETSNMKASLKFNSLSELSFEVAYIYNDIITGEQKTNPFYNRIEAPRLIFVENFGYFEIQTVELISDGIKEVKNISANSLEYVLSTKYLDHFYVNVGTVDSLEVLNSENQDKITPITLYNASNTKLSLLHLILEKVHGWEIGHVDKQLQTLSRQFEIDRESVYDFLMTEICEKFNCYIVFDTINNNTINNIINVYAESPTAKFIGDGESSVFIIGGVNDNNSPFSRIETVSIDGYKTTRWTYGIKDGEGILVLEDTPEVDAMIEVVGVDSNWDTDVFVTFDNLIQETNANYTLENIRTVLTVTYGDDLDIREVNLGLPYLTDLSYYYSVDWMGQDLYDAYTAYLTKSNNSMSQYTNNSKEILKLNDHIYYEENRLSLEYSLVESVNGTTVGTYYTRHKNADESYYYTEVNLPGDYRVNVAYYSNQSTNLNEDKVSKLYSALQNYFYAYYHDSAEDIEKALDEILSLSDSFKFMEKTTISNLVDGLKNATSDNNRENIISTFFDEMWEEIGKTPLQKMYLDPYKKIQETNMQAGWSEKDNDNYGRYYPVVLLVNSIEKEITQRDATIKTYTDQREEYQKANAEISNSLIMTENFTEKQLVRLNAFLREDELHIDDIVETDLDTLSSSFKIKQDAMETGRIELKKLCEPQLQFSMDMANIYALPEFEPIINQFQLGNIIKVGLRHDYIKQSRLLEVNINFEDFSDFSCEFGELTSLRTQSDIHADLLGQAISAGKSVAHNSSYWTQGSDKATATDLRIQQGLLDATTQIKSIDGTQGVVIDKYGIRLQKINEDGSIDPHQAWLVNNMILMTDDGWKTSRTGIGEFTVENKTFYGLIAEAVLAGHIEGSTIIGGTICIGDMGVDTNGNRKWAFKVDEFGNVSMLGGDVQFNVTDENGNYTDENGNSNSSNSIQDQIDDLKDQIKDIDAPSANMYRVEIIASGPTVISTSEDKITLTCKVYSWDSDITSTLAAGSFSWKRVSNDSEKDAEWNNTFGLQGGSSIEIDADDVRENSSFTCEVELPGEEENLNGN